MTTGAAAHHLAVIHAIGGHGLPLGGEFIVTTVTGGTAVDVRW